jgi:hypothetical protein
VLAASIFAASPSDARITRIEIDTARSQSPTFGGFSWPNVGQYEKVVGKAYGEVDPRDRQNRVIVDIECGRVRPCAARTPGSAQPAACRSRSGRRG